MATFLVTGATGTVGRATTQALLDQGHQVKAASRHPEKSQAQFGNQVEAVRFDWEDTATYQVAEGTDGVFLLGPPLYLDLFQLLVPFVDYLMTHGPRRVVYLSAYGMEHLAELPFHQQMEDKLRASDLDWRIVRPGFFMQNFSNYERENIVQRKVLFVPAGDGKTPFVSARDIGASIAVLLTREQYRHQTFVLTGSQAYDYFEVAEMLSEIRGEKIAYANPDDDTYRKALAEAGAPDFVASYMIPVYGMIKHRRVQETTDHVTKLTGRSPESLREVLQRDFS